MICLPQRQKQAFVAATRVAVMLKIATGPLVRIRLLSCPCCRAGAQDPSYFHRISHSVMMRPRVFPTPCPAAQAGAHGRRGPAPACQRHAAHPPGHHHSARVRTRASHHPDLRTALLPAPLTRLAARPFQLPQDRLRGPHQPRCPHGGCAHAPDAAGGPRGGGGDGGETTRATHVLVRGGRAKRGQRHQPRDVFLRCFRMRCVAT